MSRYPQDIEAVIYFCVLQALQNSAKYAQASVARVTLCHDGHCLAFTVAGDGTGFDQATTPVGTGLQGIPDRLAALGGTLDIASAPATAPGHRPVPAPGRRHKPVADPLSRVQSNR